jgi:hypothetical protein
MANPLDATHDAPVSATIRDCLVAAWPSNGRWTIDIGGDEHQGPPVDAAKHATLSGVKDMMKQWASEHPTLFA